MLSLCAKLSAKFVLNFFEKRKKNLQKSKIMNGPSLHQAKKRKVSTLSKERKRQLCTIIVSAQDVLKKQGQVVTREIYVQLAKNVQLDGIEPIQGDEEESYIYDQYFTQYPKSIRFVETSSAAGKRRNHDSFKASILRNAMRLSESYGKLINSEILSTAATTEQSDHEEASEDESSGFCEISVIEAEEKYPTPENCDLFLCSCHLVSPISQASLDQIVQGAKRIVFLDVESVPIIITKADYADSLLFVMYAKKLTWTLPLNLIHLLNNKRLFFVCAESGKERADGLIDAFAVDFHHRVDKKVAFAIISNDEGFGTTMTTIKYQGREIARFHVAGDADGDQVYEKIVKRFQ